MWTRFINFFGFKTQQQKLDLLLNGINNRVLELTGDFTRNASCLRYTEVCIKQLQDKMDEFYKIQADHAKQISALRAVSVGAKEASIDLKQALEENFNYFNPRINKLEAEQYANRTTISKSTRIISRKSATKRLRKRSTR